MAEPQSSHPAFVCGKHPKSVAFQIRMRQTVARWQLLYHWGSVTTWTVGQFADPDEVGSERREIGFFRCYSGR